MTAHNARAVRETGPGGVGRGWRVKCSCGLNQKAPTREAAESAASFHNVSHAEPQTVAELLESARRELRNGCTGYDPVTMEYLPGANCLHCRIAALLGRAA
jgi:hypothetical protein